MERSDGMSRFYTQEVGQNIPRRARRNREGGMHLSFIPRKRTFLSILLLLLLCRALSLSLSPADQNSFPFRSHGSSSFSTQLSFSIYSLPPSSPPTRFLARARHNATISVRPRRKRRKSLNASWTSGAAYQRRTVLTRRRGSVKSGAENNKSDNEFPTLLPILWLQRFYLQYILVCTYIYYMCIR